LAETLVKLAAGNGLALLVRPFGVGNAGWVRLVVGVRASCWVLREQARCAVFLVPAPAGHQTARCCRCDGGGCVVAVRLVGLVVV
jgi:hypothetical protein